jgi:alpha-glucosidase
MFDDKVKQAQFPPGIGSFQQLEVLANGSLFHFEDESLRIEFVAAEVVRIKISAGKSFNISPSCLETNWSAPSVKVHQRSNSTLIESDELFVEVHHSPFNIKISRSDGSLVLDGYGSSFYKQLNNGFELSRQLQPEDKIYGLGQKTGSFNRQAQSYVNWNTDILSDDPLKPTEKHAFDVDFDPYYMTIPFYIHLNSETQQAAGFFIDNLSRSEFSFTKPDNAIHAKFDFGQYTEYIFTSPQITRINQLYSELTGHQQRPPLWALGYHQCRWKEYSADALKALGKNMRDQGIPCDSLWLDIDYMNGYRVFTWNKKLFPDPKENFQSLIDDGFRVVTIVDPGVKAELGYSIFDEAQDNFCKTASGRTYFGRVWPGKTAFPDFFKESCQDWWADKIADFTQCGIGGIWIDMNEPACGDINAMDMLFERDGKLVPHQVGHNEYGTKMAQATHRGLLQAKSKERPFILSRAGSPGIQRYAANWLGDNASRWEHLPMGLSMSLGLGLSGQPFIGADIGGFCEQAQEELFLRWMQYAIWTPFFRNHNEHDQDQYPWSFSAETTALVKSSIELRYSLLPYLYSQFLSLCVNRGEALQRPLVLDYQHDIQTHDLEDQFLCGEHILIAPILKEAQLQRTVYLPSGTWYSWDGSELYVGPCEISVTCSIESIPVFVKAGSIIPQLPSIPASTASADFSEIELRIYPPTDQSPHSFELIQDDGISFDWQQGDELITSFTLQKNKNQLILSQAQSGSYSVPKQTFKPKLMGNTTAKLTYKP